MNTNIHYDLGFIKEIAREKGENLAILSENDKTIYMDQRLECMMAIHMLMGEDRDRFGSAIENFECAYLMERENRYPKTLHDYCTLL